MAKASTEERLYESMFICPMDTAQKQVDDFVEKLKSIVTNGKGKVNGVQMWGRRRLSFPINKHRDGLYVYMDFVSGRAVPKELESLYRVNDFVIRHVTLKKEEPTDLPPKRASADSVENTESSTSPQNT
jgi:small subunit ribosomal protein S6